MQIICSILIFIMVGCRTPGQGSDTKLIGGTAAEPSQFPAAVQIFLDRRIEKGELAPHCTATRIGPKHFLTAAHCVLAFNGETMPDFLKGGKIFINISHLVTTDDIKEVIVAGTFVLSDAVEMQRRIGQQSIEVWKAIADAAVVIIEDEISEVAIASLSFEPVHVGDRVVIAGYGKKQGGLPGTELRFAEVTVSEVSPTWLISNDENKIALGDSGGGVYEPDTMKIIGVNSGNPEGKSALTRLDFQGLEAMVRASLESNELALKRPEWIGYRCSVASKDQNESSVVYEQTVLTVKEDINRLVASAPFLTLRYSVSGSAYSIDLRRFDDGKNIFYWGEKTEQDRLDLVTLRSDSMDEIKFGGTFQRLISPKCGDNPVRGFFDFFQCQDEVTSTGEPIQDAFEIIEENCDEL